MFFCGAKVERKLKEERGKRSEERAKCKVQSVKRKEEAEILA